MKNLSGACCLVTGGAGFIGSAIVDQLLSAGVSEVRVIDNFVRGSRSNLEQAPSSGCIRLIDGDIRDASLVSAATEGADFVFHQAALRITRCAESPREAVEVLINGTMNVIEAALQHKVTKIVAASSASVYGEPSYQPIDEEHPFNNRTLYGAAKIANEQMLRAIYTTSGLDYVALRYFNAYGPRMDLTGVYTEVLIRWMDAIEAHRPPLIFGDGSQAMDFIYISDIARANLLAAESPVTDEVFNIGTGISTSLNELCDMLLKLMNSGLHPEYREARKVAHVQMRRAKVTKAEELLGFQSRVALQEGLAQLIRWRETAAAAVPSSVEAL